MAQSDIVREFHALFTIRWVDAGIPGLKEALGLGKRPPYLAQALITLRPMI